MKATLLPALSRVIAAEFAPMDEPRRVDNSRVYRGRCKSEPAVTVRDPLAIQQAVDVVELHNRR